MPQPSESNPPFQSQYPELKIPVEGFKSSLPEHLLEGADRQTQWIMNEISRNSAATEFACHGAVELSSHLRALNGKTYKNEKGLSEVKDQIVDLKKEVVDLKTQMRAMKPIIGPLSTIRVVFSYKIAWFILAIVVLFLAGINRDALLKIAKYFLES